MAAWGTNVALRVTDGATSYDFDWMEVKDVKVNTIQEVDRFFKQTGYIHQYRIGKKRRTVEVTLNGKYSKQTFSRAESIWNLVDAYYQPKVLRLHYRMKFDTEGITVQLDRDKFSRDYFMAYQKAGDVKMEFVESEV